MSGALGLEGAGSGSAGGRPVTNLALGHVEELSARLAPQLDSFLHALTSGKPDVCGEGSFACGRSK